MIDDELESEGGVLREAEWVGLWMLFRSGFRRMGKEIKGFHRHHALIWSIAAAMFWAALAVVCVAGLIALIHIQSSEHTCQLIGTCKR